MVGPFGGSIQANWESAGLRCYSSLDRDLLAQLCHDPAWSNEGLFTLLQGSGAYPPSEAAG